MNKISGYLIVLLSIVLYSHASAQEEDLVKGLTIAPIQKQNVRLLSEEVHVSRGAKVTANFVLENLSNKVITMKIGFPFQSPGPKDIKVLIQNKLIKVEKRLMGGTDELVIKDELSGFVYEMFVWDVSFTAKEKKVVKVEYTAQWGTGLRGNTTMNFAYITHTGGLWSGNIERADFYVELDDFAAQLLNDKKFNFKLFAYPQGYRISNNQLEWHFENWKPTEDLEILVVEESTLEQEAVLRVAPYFRGKTYEGNRSLYDSSDMNYSKIQLNETSIFGIEKRLYAKALRNEVYARHGRVFATPELKQIFESAPWYKPRQDFKESDLNEFEKKNVEFIFEYEKKMGWK